MAENPKQSTDLLSVEGYRNTLDSMLEGCQVIGFDWRYLYVNDAVARHSCRAKEELLGHTMMEMYPGIENTEMFAVLRDCMENRTPHRVDNEFTFPNGSKGWFELSIQPVPEGIFILSLDITERKLAEQKILEQSRSLDAISRLTRVISSDISLDGVFNAFTHELKGLVSFDRISITLIEGDKVRFLAVSSAIETELKAQTTYPLEGSAAGWVAKHKKTLIEPDLARQRLFSHDDIKLKIGLRSSIYVPLFSKGEVFGSLNLSSSQPNAYGEKERAILEQLATQIAGCIQNAHLYSQERAYRVELERREEEQLEFARAVGHELKTPLTSIIAAAELLSEESQGGVPETQQRLIQNIVHSARSLETNLNELLEATKIETALSLQMLPLNIKGLLERVTEELRPVAKRKKQSLMADLPDSLPLINADAQRLAQVLRNLLMNAVKFTPTGGSITLRTNKQNSHLVVEVQDNGIGIPKEEQAKLFEPYYRAEADRQHFSGLGLGLSLSKQIIELHGGRIWVTSQPGKGSTFAFSLPL